MKSDSLDIKDLKRWSRRVRVASQVDGVYTILTWIGQRGWVDVDRSMPMGQRQ
ncbi:MAG: hypothetical protein O6942_04390 [Bacteroidetes bacterium]|nr:hypothetical protein [Bacteroidota bacterium]